MQWRIARILAERAKITLNKEEKKMLLFEALEYAEKALKEHPSCFDAHKWYSIIISYIGEIEGKKFLIKESYNVKNHLEQALKINPNDAILRMMLGFWHFTFADLPSYQRYFAKIIFGTPPSSTYQEALKHFMMVESKNPGYYKPCCYYLGEIYNRLGEKEKAIVL